MDEQKFKKTNQKERFVILQNDLESGNNKPFWKYGKSQKQETFGISALKSNGNGNVITDSLSNAEILNSQLKSVFTPQSENTFPHLPGTQFPKIKPLHISENGVFMLLDRIDVSKSSGPDKLHGRLLAKEIIPVVHFIFTQSLCTANYILNGHKRIWAHLDDHKILTDRQHGTRSGRSCETQLVTTRVPTEI